MKELVINANPAGLDIALLEDKRLVELHQEKSGKQFSVGDIYLARVKKVIPGLNAAFVDVGYEKDAFLHYTDLGPQIRSLNKMTRAALAGNLGDPLLKNFKFEQDIVKTGKITEVLKNKQPILVQVLKEPISTKGPRLSCEITIPGRNIVLSPFTDTVGVSRRIESADERKRLRVLLESLKPKNFGIVVRTVAQGKGSAELHDEVQELVSKWKTLISNLQGAQAPIKVMSEMDKTASLVRDLLNDSFNNVVSNSPALSKELETYIGGIAPEKKKIVSLYEGKRPIFDNYGITKQIKSSFGKTVTMNSGAYLVLDHTEAMHVIDVNSGHKTAMGGDQESNALRVNMEAAEEIARQLRLRDIGGIIVIDFIDMRNPESRKKVLKKMKDSMAPDRATHTILPLTRFNLMQITRERVRPQVNIATQETCPSCGGTGKIESTLLLVDQIERDLKYVLESHKTVSLTAHPFIESFLKRGIRSVRFKWFLEHKKWIKVHANNDYALTEYRFFDAKGEEIKLD